MCIKKGICSNNFIKNVLLFQILRLPLTIIDIIRDKKVNLRLRIVK